MNQHASVPGAPIRTALLGLLSAVSVVLALLTAAPVANAAVDCLPGTFESGGGCVPAPPGTYVPSSSAVAPIPCEVGRFQPSQGQTSCLLAPPGTFVALEGAVEATLCPIGKHQPSAGASSCVDAPPGSFVDTQGAVLPQLCALGTYQPSIGSASCLLAAPGSFVPTDGATEATLCPVGSFSAGAGSVACNFAAPGSFVDMAGASLAMLCAPGTYQPAAGSVSCLFAPPGTFVDVVGAVQATLCAPGTYQPAAGSVSCLSADPGFFVAAAGSIQQTPCPAGTTSAAGAASCTPVGLPLTVRGFYAPVDALPVVNVIKGGRTVPLKFEVFRGDVEQVDTAVVSGFSVTRRDCTTGSAEDAIEFTTAGGTSLRYDTEAGQFVQNWKTPSVPGACYVVTLTTTGGPSLQAAFKTR